MVLGEASHHGAIKMLIPLGINIAYVLERSDDTFASPHGASGADTPYHPLHQCYTKYYVILYVEKLPTTIDTLYPV